MLDVLHIENIAVIEKADIEFSPGLNVLTGETGAGKSIVIDALGAVLGERTSRELIRTGTPAAAVTAVFSVEDTPPWFEENDVDCDGGEIIITRKLTAEGKNICRVNGTPVSVAQLKALGAALLNIHGQNDGQSLLNEKFHRIYLDSFGKLEGDLEKYRADYDAYKAVEREILELTMDESEKERRRDTLQYQIAEIERADIQPGEQAEKTARWNFLKNAGKLTDFINSAFNALYGGDGETGALTLLGDAEGALSMASRYSEELSAVQKRIADVRYEAEDITEQLRDYKESLDFSPQEFEELENRIDLLRRLSRKYGGSEEEILAFLEKCKEELDKIEYGEERLGKLQAEKQKKLEKAEASAEKLTKARRAAGEKLKKRIEGELSQLSMPNVRFEAAVEPGTLSRNGGDEVRFLMSANAGEELGRISRIASGGELSRIMLAMKNVLAENEPVGTMVFDEIDTGVSGVAAQRVGEKLSDLARTKQVICVTHLPQIAAMADAQYAIEKTVSSGRTYTQVRVLDGEGRRRELARLTGGENVTERTLLAAEEQLQAARAYKQKSK